MAEVALARDVDAVTIPDGRPARLAKGTKVRLTQALGFSYTVQTERGEKLRIAGRDGDAIGEPVVGVVGDASASTTVEETEKAARRQLQGVYDPEIPVDIVNLGLVHSCKATAVEGGFSLEVRMGLTSPGCGMGDVLVKDVEAALKAIPGVVAVDAKVVLFPVWNPYTMMSEAAKLKLGML